MFERVLSLTANYAFNNQIKCELKCRWRYKYNETLSSMSVNNLWRKATIENMKCVDNAKFGSGQTQNKQF